jgi:hypothetical protein
MSAISHTQAQSNPHDPTGDGGGIPPRIEYAHPLLRALAEAEHPEFLPSKPMKHIETVVVARVTLAGEYGVCATAHINGNIHDAVSLVVFDSAVHVVADMAVTTTRPLAWWTAANVASVIDTLEALRVDGTRAELLKSVIAIMADDERRDV